MVQKVWTSCRSRQELSNEYIFSEDRLWHSRERASQKLEVVLFIFFNSLPRPSTTALFPYLAEIDMEALRAPAPPPTLYFWQATSALYAAFGDNVAENMPPEVVARQMRVKISLSLQ